MKKILIFLGLIFSMFQLPLAHAEGQAQFNATHVIELDANYSAKVKTIFDVDIGDDSLPQFIELPLIGANAQGVTASFADGEKVTATEVNEEYVRLSMSSAIANFANKFSITLNYSSQPARDFGNSKMFLIPPLSYGGINIENESISVQSPAELEEPLIKGSDATTSSVVGGTITHVWKNSGSSNSGPIGLLYGDAAVAQATYRTELKNDSFWWQTKSFVLPPDTNQQRVLLESVTPKPKNISLDTDGNMIVEYSLRPKQTLAVAAVVKIAIHAAEYPDSTSRINDVPDMLRDTYTTLDEGWTDASDIDVERMDSSTVMEIVEQLYSIVAEAKPDGMSTYEIAIHRSNTLVGELRSAGIPARTVAGVVYGNGRELFDAPQASVWAEAHIPNIGWITLDPNFGVNSEDYFGSSSIDRVALSLRGFHPDHPPVDIEKFEISYTSEMAPGDVPSVPEITMTKYVLLPGLSISSTKIKMPSGVIVDGASVLIKDEKTAIGSLAPLQEVTIRGAKLGISAHTKEDVLYSYLDGDGNETIAATTTSQANYSVIAGMIALAALIAGGRRARVVWIKRRREKATKNRPSTPFIREENIEEIVQASRPHTEQRAVKTQEEPVPQKTPHPEIIQKRPLKKPVHARAIPLRVADTGVDTLASQKIIPVHEAKRTHHRRVRNEVRKARRPLIQ